MFFPKKRTHLIIVKGQFLPFDVGIYLKSVEACNMSINNSPPLVMDVPESPERRLQIINGEGISKYRIGMEHLKCYFNVLSIENLF